MWVLPKQYYQFYFVLIFPSNTEISNLFLSKFYWKNEKSFMKLIKIQKSQPDTASLDTEQELALLSPLWKNL